jgi:ribonuclease HI
MSKYYGVIVGRKPGIYTSWTECENQVRAFSCAKYKSFSTLGEARSYVGLEELPIKSISTLPSKSIPTLPSKSIPSKSIPTLPSKSILNVYTDGSHSKGNGDGYLGFGAYCEYRGVEYTLSQACTPKVMKRFGIKEEDFKSCSNPTAELLAFAYALRELKGVGSSMTLIFYIDYIGVEAWMTGTWNATKPYISAVRDYGLKLIKRYKLNVEYVHVSGHSGCAGNEAADAMAKCRDNFNTFDKLVEVVLDSEDEASSSTS